MVRSSAKSPFVMNERGELTKRHVLIFTHGESWDEREGEFPQSTTRGLARIAPLLRRWCTSRAPCFERHVDSESAAYARAFARPLASFSLQIRSQASTS